MSNIVLTDELHELLAQNDVEAIRALATDNHPADIADFLSDLETDDEWKLLRCLPIEQRVEIFVLLDLEHQARLVVEENRKEMAQLIEEMPADDRADLIQKLDVEVRDAILPLVARAEREDIRRLVAYEESTAGAVMSTDYAVLRPTMSASEAIDQLRVQSPEKETIYYVYVVDTQWKLVGFVSLRDLILSRPSKLVGDLMKTEIIKVNVHEDQEEVAAMVEKYDLIALPVIDDDGRLVGIVTHDDAMDIVQQEAQEDIEKIMGIGGSHEVGEYLRTSSLAHFRSRIPWIAGLSMMSIGTGMIMHLFEHELNALVILALYIPMITGVGGNVGSQATTVVVRALAVKDVKPIFADMARVLTKELTTALLIAAVVVWISFGKVWILSGNTILPGGMSVALVATTIALATALQIVSATTLGALLPLAAAKMKLDPAVIASPALTTSADISGLVIYFITAKLMLGI